MRWGSQQKREQMGPRRQLLMEGEEEGLARGRPSQTVQMGLRQKETRYLTIMISTEGVGKNDSEEKRTAKRGSAQEQYTRR